MTTTDPLEYAEKFTRLLSVNPELDDSPGEDSFANLLSEHLENLGASVTSQEVKLGRSNIFGELSGGRSGTLVFEAHLDTVPLPGADMPSGISNGRLWGRGSCDTKASAAAMLSAMEIIARNRDDFPTIIFAGIVDEEFEMKGAIAASELLQQSDGIIIGEPTNLAVTRAHNGCIRFRVTVSGKTAHSSRASLGDNAITNAGYLIVHLEENLTSEVARRRHWLTGEGCLSITQIEGGVAPNVVPDECVLSFDRRLVPGESATGVLDEVDQHLHVFQDKSGIHVERSEPWLELPAMETPADHPLVRLLLEEKGGCCDSDAVAQGVPYCTDANIFSGLAQIPSVVVGPGSIDQAHAPLEWVLTDEIYGAVDLYVGAARRFAMGSKR